VGGTHALHGFASPYLNLRGLVLNFINKKFLLLFLFSVADFFSRAKSFIDILGGGTHALHGSTSPHLNLRGLVFNLY
jgi:hypothetical protein